MPLPRPTIVIFDMDGTTVRHVNPRLLHILEKIDDMIFAVARFWRRIFRKGDKATIYDVDPYTPIKKPRLIVHRALHKVRRKPVEEIVQPCPGIYSVLGLLKACNIPTGIVSNGLGKGYGHDILQKFELERYFDSALFREDLRHSKPNPEAILSTLDKLGISAGPMDVIWFIGDRHKDIAAALAAQEHTMGKMVPIAYGLNAAFAVIEKNVGADHIMLSYYEMYDILNNLLNGAQPSRTMH